MERVVEGAVPEFVKQGLLGVVIVVLAIVIVFLVRHILAQNEEIKGLNTKLVAATREAVDSLNTTSKSLAALATAVETSEDHANDRLEAIREVVANVIPIGQGVAANSAAIAGLRDLLTLGGRR